MLIIKIFPLTYFLTFAGILLSNISCKDSIVDPIVKHNKIVYLTDKDGTVGIISTNYINHQIFVMDLDGMNQNNISLTPDTDFVSIDYAPLTKKLLSRHVTINASYYYTMNLDGTQKRLLLQLFKIILVRVLRQMAKISCILLSALIAIYLKLI